MEQQKRSGFSQLINRLASARIWTWVWGAAVFLLPVTSMPLVIRLVHSDVVGAPSSLILALFMLGWFLPRLCAGEKIAQNGSLLTLFIIAALFSTAVSFFRQIPVYKNSNTITPALSAVLTLFIGFCFYLGSALWNQDPKRLKLTLRLVNWSGLFVLLWTLTQAFFWYKDFRYPQWMKTIQFSISAGSLYRQRFVGFTLEPSWLAHQLNLLYLPYWFAASITGFSAHSRRGKFLTFERLLFLSGMAVLFLTLSRVGLAAFLLTVLFFVIQAARKWIARLAIKSAGNRTDERAVASHRKILTFVFSLAILTAAAGLLVLLGWLLSKLDFRMRSLFSLDWRGRSDPVYYIAEKLSLAARFVYWDAGLGIFHRHPLLGVGLGHAGFYLPGELNAYALKLIEVRKLLFRSDTLMNIKSLWIRILAETGIAGFSCFVIWLLRVRIKSQQALKGASALMRTMGWMGCFVCLAFLLEGFSLDTFAMPYVWFSTGMVSALVDAYPSAPEQAQ